MDEVIETKELNLKEKLVDKNWKNRVEGYKELTDLIQTSDTNLEDIYQSYNIELFLDDNNAIALEKALQFILDFAKIYDGSSLTEIIVPKIINKGLSSVMRKTTAELSKEVVIVLAQKEGYLKVLEIITESYSNLKNKKLDKIVNCMSILLVAVIELIDTDIKDTQKQADLLTTLLAFYQHSNVKIRKDGLSGLSLIEGFVDEEVFENEILSNLKATQLKELDKIRKPRPVKKAKTWEEKKGTNLLNEEYINAPVFLQNLQNPDWKIRVEVLKDTLSKLDSLEKINYVEEKYNHIFTGLAKVINKDVNLQIVQLSVALVDKMFDLIKDSQYIASYIPLVISEELSRMKDKKLTGPIKQSISEMVRVHPEKLLFFKNYFINNFGDKLLIQRTECLALFNDLMEQYTTSIKNIFSIESIEEILPVLIKFCKESQPNVRHQGFRIFALFFKYIPDAEDELISQLDKMLDSLKIKKIAELKLGYEDARKRPATSPLKIEKVRKQKKPEHELPEVIEDANATRKQNKSKDQLPNTEDVDAMKRQILMLTQENQRLKEEVKELKETSRMSSYVSIPERASRVNSGASISSFASFDEYYNNQLAQTTQLQHRVQNISRRLSSINLSRNEYDK